MEQELLNIGFGSTVVSDRVVAIVSPNSAPMKRLKDEAREQGRLIDATHGRRTRSIIILDSNHVVLSAIQSETVSQRFATLKESSSKDSSSKEPSKKEPASKQSSSREAAPKPPSRKETPSKKPPERA